MVEEELQQEARGGSWQISPSSTHRKQMINWKHGEAINSQILLPVMHFLQEATSCESSITSQIEATNWRPGIQILEYMEDISHSNHNCA